MYRQANLESFKLRHGHQTSVQYQNGVAGPARQDSNLPLIPEPYSIAQALRNSSICDNMADAATDSFDLNDPNSGFTWYSCSKFEHQIISVRHLQHHAA
jgi:hypothetical protein